MSISFIRHNSLDAHRYAAGRIAPQTAQNWHNLNCEASLSPTKIKPPEWDRDGLRRAIDAAGVSMWTWNVVTQDFAMDERGYDLWGISADLPLTFEMLSEKIFPADRDTVNAAFAASRAMVGTYEIDFRTLTGPHIRWISARGQGSEAASATSVTTGIFLDVTQRKQAEEGHELIAGEMSHRVKNLLAIASGLARITSRSSTSIEDMTKQLMQRLTALGRAHDLVRPRPGGKGGTALLGDIFSVLLAPYDEAGSLGGRIRVAVPRMGVGQEAANALALVVHELATNAVKYGALSNDVGTLDITGSMVDEKLQIVWIEHGGPEKGIPATLAGFGSSLVRQTVEGQLRGSISYDWPKGGAMVSLMLDAERVST